MFAKETEIEFSPSDFSLKDKQSFSSNKQSFSSNKQSFSTNKQYLSVDILVRGQRVGHLYFHDPVIESAYQLPVYLDYDSKTNEETVVLMRQAVAEKLGIEPSQVKFSPWRK